MNPMPAQNVFRLHPPDDWPAAGIIPVNQQQEWPGSKPVQHDVTRILKRIQDGELQLADSLLPLVYKELRNLARARMAAEKPGQTLQATALVHEAYLRLVGNDEITWDSRGHFFSAAAEAMRRILIERARRKGRIRHGAELRRTAMDAEQVGMESESAELLDLDRALTALEANDERMASIVKLRYFAGLSIEETASALDLSPRTVNRDWLAAKAWLLRELKTASPPDPS